MHNVEEKAFYFASLFTRTEINIRKGLSSVNLTNERPFL
jgi:hypothetical protein